MKLPFRQNKKKLYFGFPRAIWAVNTTLCALTYYVDLFFYLGLLHKGCSNHPY